MRWLLDAAEALQAGHLILEPFTARDSHNRRVKRVRAVLMHTGDGIAPVGIGKTATEAASELRGALEREIERLKR